MNMHDIIQFDKLYLATPDACVRHALLLQFMHPAKVKKRQSLFRFHVSKSAKEKAEVCALDVGYVHSEGNLSWFYVWNGKEYVKYYLDFSMKYSAALLEPMDFRLCHESWLVNPLHIQTISNDGLHYVLKDDSEVPIARRHKDDIKDLSVFP